MNDPRILVFSATFGDGHVRAADALIESIYEVHPNAQIAHIDAMAMLNKQFNIVLKDFYLGMIKRTPKLWGDFYYGTAGLAPDSRFQRLLNNLGQSKYVKCINTFQPDLIICTYPTIAGVMGKLRSKKALSVPVVTVITDYTVHSQWIHAGVDLYIVGCEDVYNGLVSRGIDPERIKVTGIPVSPKFENTLDRLDLMTDLGLNPSLPTLLVMGGAYGVLDDIKGVCKVLADTSVPCQTLVVCGRDEKLYASLDEVMLHAKNPMLKYGFVSNVDELMTVADLVITKAGGLTVSEALTKGVPMLIYKPIPGQEEKNAAFLEKSGAARAVSNRAELEETIFELLRKPAALTKMKKAAATTLPGQAAQQAVRHILQLIEENYQEARVG